MKRIVYLSKSKKKGKKWTVYIDPPGKTIHFGASGMSDYTIHKDRKRMMRYNMRHKKHENWGCSGILSAGFWSKNLLWNKPSFSQSKRDIARRCDVQFRSGTPKKSMRNMRRSRKHAGKNRKKKSMRNGMRRKRSKRSKRKSKRKRSKRKSKRKRKSIRSMRRKRSTHKSIRKSRKRLKRKSIRRKRSR